MNQSAMHIKMIAIFKVEVTMSAHVNGIIRMWLFLLYLLDCWFFCITSLTKVLGAQGQTHNEGSKFQLMFVEIMSTEPQNNQNMTAIYNPNMTSPWWPSTSALTHQQLVCLMGERCHHSAWVWTTWLCLWQASICCVGQTLWQTFVDRWTVDSLSCDRWTVDNLSHDRWTVNNLSCNRWMNCGQLVLWQMNCGQLVPWQMNCGQLVLWHMNCGLVLRQINFGQLVLWQMNCGQLVLWQMNWTICPVGAWADALYCFIYFLSF